jgi:hypothetical protein
MKLRDLEPRFVHYAGDPKSFRYCERDEANGLWFLCPKCFTANGGCIGTQRVQSCNQEFTQTLPTGQ